MPQMVWAEFESDGRAVRIFKTRKLAMLLMTPIVRVAHVLRSVAVTDIRLKIWHRDKKKCTHCGQDVSWGVMEMHERLWRGRGGEISVDNGTTLCYDCHQHDDVAGHGKRQVKWSKAELKR